MAVNALQSLYEILELLPIEVTENNDVLVRNNTGWKEVCSAVGYLDIGVVWTGNLVIVWTMLYMLSLSWQMHRLPQASHHIESRTDGTVYVRSRVREIAGVLFVILAPFLFNWIPFAVHMYGPSDFTCWIKTFNIKSGCGNRKLEHWSIALMTVLYYGPITATVTFVLVCFVVIICLLHRASRYLHGGIQQRYKSSMKKMVILLIYPSIYNLFCIIMLATRIRFYFESSDTDHVSFYQLWILHSVADAGRMVLPALGFFMHPDIWKTIVRQCCPSWSPEDTAAHTRYYVPPEGSDISEGISIQPSGEDYGSIRGLFN
jgi:hypothetical protein